MMKVVQRYLRVLGLVVLTGCFSGFTQAQDKPFDHAETGFELTGGHNFVPCESCHVGGQFAGTPTECVACHSINGRFNATPKPVEHIFTSERCDTCHSAISWQAVPVVDHHEVFGRCENCHNNIIVSGKPVDHIPVHNQCSDCHSDLSWQPARMNHDNVGDNCVSCHNNINALGQPAGHIPVLREECGGCHFTSFFNPVREVNHDLLSEDCASCHFGQFAETVFPPNHIAVLPVCRECHNTNAFVPVDQVNHDFLVSDDCQSCHAADKPMTHINIQQNAPCDACHISKEVWPSVPVVDHEWVVGTCRSCHDGVTARGQHPQHIPTGALECSVCHNTTAFSSDVSF